MTPTPRGMDDCQGVAVLERTQESFTQKDVLPFSLDQERSGRSAVR